MPEEKTNVWKNGKKIGFMLTPEVYEALERAAAEKTAREGRLTSQSEFIRQAIQEALTHTPAESPADSKSRTQGQIRVFWATPEMEEKLKERTSKREMSEFIREAIVQKIARENPVSGS